MAIEFGYALSRILTIYQDHFGSSTSFDEGSRYTPTVLHRPLLSVDAISTILSVVGAMQVVLEKLAAKRSSKSRKRLIIMLETMKAALKLACLFQTRQMLLDGGKTVRQLWGDEQSYCYIKIMFVCLFYLLTLRLYVFSY